MAKAQLQPIYARLNGIDNYHPYSANTFTDWSVEAGDIVTVNRGDESYSSPVHSVNMRWSGQSKVVLESKGEKTRGSVAVMSAKNYSSGGGGGNSYRSSRGGSRATNEKLAGLEYIIEDGLEGVRIYAQNIEGDMEADFKVLSDKISAEVTNRKNKDKELSGRIDVEAGKVGLLVEERNGKNVIKAASIVAEINGSGSNVAISADHIKLDGATNLNDVLTVSNGMVSIKKPLLVSGAYATFNEIRIYNARFALNQSNAENIIVNASVDGNVLTLTKASGQTVPFSKATTLTGEWSGNIAAGMSYKVTAKQNGVTVGSPHYSPALDAYYMGVKSWEDNYHTLKLPVTVYDANGTDLYRETLSIDTTAAYEAGSGSAPSYRYHKTITFNRIEELPSGTLRYHYYTTGEYIIQSGTKTVYYN